MTITQGYCTIPECIRYVRRGDKILSPSSPLSTADIETMIDNVGEELNSLLRNLQFTVPISSSTSPRAYAYMRMTNAVCAAADIDDRLFAETGDMQTLSPLAKRCRDLKAALSNGQAQLSDAVGGDLLEADIADSGTNNLTASGAEKEAFFKRLDSF